MSFREAYDKMYARQAMSIQCRVTDERIVIVQKGGKESWKREEEVKERSYIPYW